MTSFNRRVSWLMPIPESRFRRTCAARKAPATMRWAGPRPAERPVEIGHRGPLRHQHRRRHGQRRADHAAHHDAIAPRPRAASRSASASVSPPVLSSLMLTMSYLPPARAARPVMAAFVGADRHRAVEPGQRRIIARGQRLLDQRHPQPDQMRRQIGVDLGRPALVGIDDDPRIRRARAHRLQPGHVVLVPSLIFSSGRWACAAPLGGASLGRIERQGIGGDLGPGRGSPASSQTRGPPLGLQIPQRAIDRVARRPGRQQVLQRGARHIARAGLRSAPSRCRASRRSAHRARIRRAPSHRPASSATVSTFAPRCARRARWSKAAPSRRMAEAFRANPIQSRTAGYRPASASTSRPAPWRNGSTVGRPIRASISSSGRPRLVLAQCWVLTETPTDPHIRVDHPRQRQRHVAQRLERRQRP
jgi:hypothetical protein